MYHLFYGFFFSSRSRYLALFKWIEMLIVYIHTYCCRLKEKKEEREGTKGTERMSLNVLFM